MGQSVAETVEVFNQLTSQLSASYDSLESQMVRLNNELANARSARLRERQQRERLADRLEVMLEALPAAVLLVDGRGRIDRFNAMAVDFFPRLGWGRRWPEVRDETLAEQTTNGDWRLNDGRLLDPSLRPLRDGGLILVLVDVTDRRALEQAAERKERLAAMGEMAAQLAHQVRTPLSAALLYAGQLGDPALPQAQRGAFAEKLLARLRHTERLVADMLHFTRGGGQAMQAVDLCEVVREAHDTVRPRLDVPGDQLSLAVPDSGPCWVRGNRDALLGALTNLLDNALQHAGRPVQATLALTVSEQGYHLRVADNGPGIPADVVERIFDPFFTTRPGGTGLGLAVVQAVVLDHGGKLTCANAAGAVFEFTLPRLAMAGPASNGGRLQ